MVSDIGARLPDTVKTPTFWYWVAIGLLAALTVVGHLNYLLFHAIAEGLSIVVGAAIFLIVWNTRHHIEQGYLLIISVAYLSVAFLDGVHTLSYGGMGVFQEGGTDLPAQLWLGARYLEALTLLSLPFLNRFRLDIGRLLAIYTAIVTLFLLSIFRWDIFPICHADGQLTPFKIASEYVIIGMFALSLWGLRWMSMDAHSRRYLSTAIIVTMISEMMFTLYSDPNGLLNMMGHLLKIMSIYFVYLALVERALRHPYDVLFSSLQRREKQYRALFDTMSEGFALHEIICDAQGNCQDYRFLEVNAAFEQLTGLKREAVIGKSAKELLPKLEQAWIDHYSAVALTGEPRRFEQYAAELGKHYSVAVYCPSPGQFATIFADVSEEKEHRRRLEQEIQSRQQAQEQLRALNDELEQRVRERTSLAQQRAEQLQHLAIALTKAEEVERQRLARLLHDDLQQTLAAVKYRLMSLKGTLPDASPETLSLLASADDLIGQSITESRSLSHDLSPYVLRSGNLGRILQYACAEALEKHGLEVDLQIETNFQAVGEAVCGLVLRSTRELLFNVVKHASVSKAQVRLSAVDDHALIVVQDAGKGFTPKPGGETGMGLGTIRERLLLIGGQMIIDSLPGSGTRITLQVPIEDGEAVVVQNGEDADGESSPSD